MTIAQAQQFICKAALLEDTEASAFLNQQLSELSDFTEGAMELLLAYGWLAPQDALTWYQSASFVPTNHPVGEWLEQLLEAQQFGAKSAEELMVYSTLTALLPSSPEQERRLRVQWLARAMISPERILEDPHWYRQLTNPFLKARLWKWFPKQYWEELQKYPMLLRGSYPVGQLMLAYLGESGHLPLLFNLTLARQHYAKGAYKELEVFALLAALDTLETHHPRELKNALQSLIFYDIPEQGSSHEELLMARLLVLIARLDRENGNLLRPFVVRVSQAVDGRAVRRWARVVARHIAQFGPVPDSAYQLARVVRLLALKHYIEVIVANGQASWPGDIPRVQRWLERSERVIGLLPERSWREYFLAKRARLQVRR